ncbi:PREDICTED: activin receptor type-2B-like [Acropora digitifera]|uniref:activin receptor type-2B-like n=1 Tax=Acropora digitifera TaxID=70779 RepID=UPI00077AF95C|nr:PREDICTED: activin receptor type-2B-like [Acropora digitifera]
MHTGYWLLGGKDSLRKPELCGGDMSGGYFQAFSLFLLVFYCLGVFSSTHTFYLRCQHRSSNETNSTCKANEFCYSAWRNDNGTPVIDLQGCWNRDIDDCHWPTCQYGVETSSKGFYFCCCNSSFCNTVDKIGLKPTEITSTWQSSTSPSTTSSSTLRTNVLSPTEGTDTIKILLFSVVPSLTLALLSVCGVFMWRHRISLQTHVREEESLRPLPPPSPDLGIRPIQLVEVISQGQFGTVWRAKYLQDAVAVKILPLSHKTAWVCERDIYTSCNVKHENILHFIAAEKHSDGEASSSLRLITEYHENGSLADYLKKRVVNWQELCSMAGSMAGGLAYLHTELQGARFKPCIAHRDVKSKNVLVKKDLTCCLSDFGLATKFHSGEDPGETHGQVRGENDFLLFLSPGPIEEYRLPFEEEVGSHPSLEDMQLAVVHLKLRPKFREDWFAHQGMAYLLQTIEECWDQDAEARLTAQCVAERVRQLQASFSLGSDQLPAVTTVVNDTNINTPLIESTFDRVKHSARL